MRAVFLAFSITVSCAYFWHDWPFLTYGFGRNLQLKVGMIIGTDVQYGEKLGSRSYEPIVHYRYIVDNKEYYGKHIAVSLHTQRKHQAEALVRKYSNGENVDVYFPRAHPSFALLDPRFPWEQLIGRCIGTLLYGVLFYLFLHIVASCLQQLWQKLVSARTSVDED